MAPYQRKGRTKLRGLDELSQEESESAYAQLTEAAEHNGHELFEALRQEHMNSLAREEERGMVAFKARHKAIERIGLPEVRQYRISKCISDEMEWKNELSSAKKVLPEIRPLLMMSINAPNCGHLVALARHTPVIVEAFLGLAGYGEIWELYQERTALQDNSMGRRKSAYSSVEYSDRNVIIDVAVDRKTASRLNQRQLWFLGRLQRGDAPNADATYERRR